MSHDRDDTMFTLWWTSADKQTDLFGGNYISEAEAWSAQPTVEDEFRAQCTSDSPYDEGATWSVEPPDAEMTEQSFFINFRNLSRHTDLNVAALIYDNFDCAGISTTGISYLMQTPECYWIRYINPNIPDRILTEDELGRIWRRLTKREAFVNPDCP